jgi:hypothetical protein
VGRRKLVPAVFCDADNVPPWDIWVAYEERVLISWVPPGLTAIAQMGIDSLAWWREQRPLVEFNYLPLMSFSRRRDRREP